MPITNRNKCMQFKLMQTKIVTSTSATSMNSVFWQHQQPFHHIPLLPRDHYPISLVKLCFHLCLIINTLLKFLFLSLTLQSIVISHSVQSFVCCFLKSPFVYSVSAQSLTCLFSAFLGLMLVWPHLWITLWSWLFDIKIYAHLTLPVFLFGYDKNLHSNKSTNPFLVVSRTLLNMLDA